MCIVQYLVHIRHASYDDNDEAASIRSVMDAQEGALNQLRGLKPKMSEGPTSNLSSLSFLIGEMASNGNILLSLLLSC